MKEIIELILLNSKFIGSILTVITFIFIGYFLMKKKMVTEEVKNFVNFIVMDIALPAMAFKAFLSDFDQESAKNNISIILMSILIFIVLLTVSNLIFIRKEKDQRKTYGIMMSLGQVSFFSLPIIEAIYGTNEALIPINLVIFIFRFFLYFYAYAVYSGMKMNKENIKESLKKILLNPIMIAMLFGVFIWLTQGFMPKVEINSVKVSFLRIDITLPAVYNVLKYASNLVIPLSMMLIGFTLGKVNIKNVIKMKDAWFIAAFRTIVGPLVAFGVLMLTSVIFAITFNEYETAGVVFGFAAPTSAVATAYSIRFNKNAYLASSVCFISTMISIITFPIIYMLIRLL